jgi:hypothetical protein
MGSVRYPRQDGAPIKVVLGANVVLAAPTGSGEAERALRPARVLSPPQALRLIRGRIHILNPWPGASSSTLLRTKNRGRPAGTAGTR